MACLFVSYAFFCCCFIWYEKQKLYEIRKRINCNNIALRSNRIYEECKYSVKARSALYRQRFTNKHKWNALDTHTHPHIHITQLCIPTQQQIAINKFLQISTDKVVHDNGIDDNDEDYHGAIKRKRKQEKMQARVRDRLAMLNICKHYLKKIQGKWIKRHHETKRKEDELTFIISTLQFV